MIYNRNHRTAWGRGLSTLRLCFLTEDNVTGGVGSQREGLSGVSSLTLALISLMALWRWGLRTKFSGTFIRARPIANTDHPTGSNPFRWRNVSLSRSTTWEPGIGLFSYNSSPLSFQCNTSCCFFNFIQQLSSPSFVNFGYTFHELLLSCCWKRIIWRSFVCRFCVLNWFGGFCCLGVVNFTWRGWPFRWS